MSTQGARSRALSLALVVFALLVGLLWGVFVFQNFPSGESWLLRWRGETLTFLQPRAFVLLAALPLLVLAQRWSLADLHPLQQFGASLVRALLLAALAAALAQPGGYEREATPCVVHLVDRSQSMTEDMIAEGISAANETWDALDGVHVHLIAFDEGATIISPDEGGGWSSLARSEGAASLRSDLSAALRRAHGLCPTSTAPGFLIHSDGNLDRSGMLAQVQEYAAHGTRIHASLPQSEAPDEVLIEGVTFPDRVLADEPFRATLTLRTRRATEVTLELARVGLRPERRTFELRPGQQDIDWTLQISEPGRHELQFSLQPSGDDRFEENNEWLSVIEVIGREQVLYVEGVTRSRSYLARALDRRRNADVEFDLDVRSATGMPYSLEEMRNYEAIIISDVAARFVSRRAMENLRTYVRDHGGGLILAGGEDAFGPGGYRGTTIEAISPLRFTMERERNLPSLAMMLVIDRSGSMSGTKIEMARAAAAASIEMLGPQDYVGVIAFDDVPQTAIRLQSAASRARLIDEVNRISPAGGTAIFPALEEAFLQLAAQPARIKHVILLSDGQASWEGIAELVEAMRASSISVSSVAVGNGADRALLEMVAELGDGRFYGTQDPRDVPQIFIRETAEVARTSFVEEPIRATVTRNHPMLRGVPISNAPYLLGYVSTRARQQADVLLSSERGDPLLATWRQGAGRVTVFTSDVKNRWSVEWLRHPVYQRLWTNIVTQTMRQHEERSFDVFIEHSTEGTTIFTDTLDDASRFVNQLRVEATLRRGDEVVTATLEQEAPGRYAHRFDDLPRGVWSYELRWLTPAGDLLGRSEGSFNRPYPEEYLRWTFDEDGMRSLAEAGNGLLNPSAAALRATEGREEEVRIERWSWFLQLALALFALDILLRRLRFGRARPQSWADAIGTTPTVGRKEA